MISRNYDIAYDIILARVGWPGPCGRPGIRVDYRCKGGSALCRLRVGAATPSAGDYKNAASEITRNKYLGQFWSRPGHGHRDGSEGWLAFQCTNRGRELLSIL
jgi:hypothetical protein